MNEFSWFVTGMVLGYFLYPLWTLLKKIWHNARAAAKESDPYQNPNNWGG